MAVLTTAKKLRVCGLDFLAEPRTGGWRCGCVVLRYLTPPKRGVTGEPWLAAAPGVSTRGDSPEAALRQLRNRAAAVIKDLGGV